MSGFRVPEGTPGLTDCCSNGLGVSRVQQQLVTTMEWGVGSQGFGHAKVPLRDPNEEGISDEAIYAACVAGICAMRPNP